MSEAQLAGGEPPVCASKTADVPALVSVLQLGSPVTVWVKAVASSLMQAEYCATVAVQLAGRSLQPGLVNAPPSPLRQALSWLVQFCCSTASDGALLDDA